MPGRVSITLSVKRYSDPFGLLNKLGVPGYLSFYMGGNSKGYALFIIPSSNQGPLADPDQLADTVREKKHPLVKRVKVNYIQD